MLFKHLKTISKFDENTLEYEIPSLALKLGHSLKTCADIAKSKAIIEGDNRKKQEMSDFSGTNEHRLDNCHIISSLDNTVHTETQ